MLASAISGVLLVPLGFLANDSFIEVARNDFLSLGSMVIILVAPFLGISAFRMAFRDLESIRNGIIPLSGLAATMWGKYLGIVGSVANSVLLLVFLAQVISSSGSGMARDSMIHDLNGLFADAYQYRIRPAAEQGGSGVYDGYHVPALWNESDDGVYTASILHSDTLQLTATWRDDSASTITVRLGPDGRPVGSWSFSGVFKE